MPPRTLTVFGQASQNKKFENASFFSDGFRLSSGPLFSTSSTWSNPIGKNSQILPSARPNPDFLPIASTTLRAQSKWLTVFLIRLLKVVTDTQKLLVSSSLRPPTRYGFPTHPHPQSPKSDHTEPVEPSSRPTKKSSVGI